MQFAYGEAGNQVVCEAERNHVRLELGVVLFLLDFPNLLFHIDFEHFLYDDHDDDYAHHA